MSEENKSNEPSKQQGQELPKKYDPKVSEPKWQNFWEENQVFAFDPNKTENIFSIDTPPPTVSGKMHLGHAFGNSQQDFIARFKRMTGHNVLQPFGTDDNGLPTKLLVEKLKKVKAGFLGRKEFRQLCLDTLNNELKPKYIEDWKRLGVSCDFNVTYSTIDPHSQKVSQKSFIDLYKKGREYRAEAPAMYCPKCQTAISQVECEDKDIASFFNDIVFKVDNEELIVATTRPELLPACVAVFYHPSDERYQHLKGKMATVPLFGFEVPLLEDERADPQKGTGIVMCCTFGDQTDMEWQKAHKLPIKEAIGKNGKMTSLAEKYEGLKIEEARKQIIEDMKEQNLLKAQKPINHAVNVHERCGTPIEFIHSKQWFIKYLDLKEDMFKWGNSLEWHPSHMKNRFDNWVNGLAWDWCISRQLPFGIPFPVWYCKDCDEVILADEKNLPVDPNEDKPHIDKCPKCGCTEFVGEKDILNTWATSSLTPTIVKELFKDKPVYKYLTDNPMNLRPQGHDIISFWLFNTVVKSNLHFEMQPWDTCFINGWMLDPKGKKMSKSKGNVIEPQVMIEKYSADSLRYMAAGCKLGEDLAFPEKDVMTGKKTVTKLWNASRFGIMNLSDYEPKDIAFKDLTPIDQWLISKLNHIIKISTTAFENYEFSKAKAQIDNFFWNTFCDYYLEMTKDRVFNSESYTTEEIESFKFTLYSALNSILKMFAPFIPFITEEIYQMYFKQFESKTSIHITSWPQFVEEDRDEKVEQAGNLATVIVGAARKHKSENKLSLKEELAKAIIKCTNDEKALLEIMIPVIKATAKIKEIEFETSNEISEIEVKF
jgi:valyl-tRNA synthetase